MAEEMILSLGDEYPHSREYRMLERRYKLDWQRSGGRETEDLCIPQPTKLVELFYLAQPKTDFGLPLLDSWHPWWGRARRVLPCLLLIQVIRNSPAGILYDDQLMSRLDLEALLCTISLERRNGLAN